MCPDYLPMNWLLLVQDSHSDWKRWQNGKAFSSQGKLLKILEKLGNFRQMIFTIFSDI